MNVDCKNVTYAIKDGSLIHISDVKSGLECGCRCSGCGGQLIAKKGDIKVHHFAHLNTECEYAYESMVHYICKNSFQFIDYFELPKYDDERYPLDGLKYGQNNLSIPRKTIDLSMFEIMVEYTYNEIIADVALLIKGKPVLFIEIANTHFIDDIKLSKIKRYKISCLEIDVSKFPIDFHSTHDITKSRSIQVIKEFMEDNCKWIVNEKLKNEYAVRRLKTAWLHDKNSIWGRIYVANRLIKKVRELGVTKEVEFIYNRYESE
jgi:hypothetical protein